jgi:hypothetical protein
LPFRPDYCNPAPGNSLGGKTMATADQSLESQTHTLARKLGACAALLALVGTGACGLLIPKVNRAGFVQRATASNPMTGKPAEYGFISEKDEACDELVPKDATRLRVEGDKLCVDQRRSVTAEIGDVPDEKTWVTRVKTETGITDRITMTGRATVVARCTKGTSYFKVWTYEVSGCAANNGVLTAKSTSAALRDVEAINGEGDEFMVFSFATDSASAAPGKAAP